MAGVLLILSEMRDGTDVVTRAVEKAAEDRCELLVLSVLDPAVMGKAASRLTEQGQVGTTPSRGLAKSVQARHEQLAREQTADILERARAASVATRAIVRHGNYVREATEVITAERPDTVMIEKRPRSLLRMRSADAFLDGLAVEVGFKLLEI
jgi:hypothetical protein